jgi:hypothetical protein
VPDSTGLARAYIHAKRTVLSSGFGWEILWQRARSSAGLSEPVLLREAAWVILSAGMREAVIRSKFPAISESFMHWQSAVEIASSEQSCFNAAMTHFGNELKIRAICTVAVTVSRKGFDQIVDEISADPLIALRQFPYIGAVTSFHLAKNLGIPVAKPDRHLARLAKSCRCSDSHTLCRDIAQFTGDPIDVVDVVLWRFATITSGNYAEFAQLAGTSEA